MIPGTTSRQQHKEIIIVVKISAIKIFNHLAFIVSIISFELKLPVLTKFKIYLIYPAEARPDNNEIIILLQYYIGEKCILNNDFKSV